MIKKWSIIKVYLCVFLSCPPLYASMTELDLNTEYPLSRLSKINVRQKEKTSPSINFSKIRIVVPKENLFVPSKLGNITVTYENNEFYLQKSDFEKFQIQRWNLSRELRSIKDNQLRGFLNKGYLSIDQLDNGEFTINAHVRGSGGAKSLVVVRNITFSFGGLGGLVGGLVRGEQLKLVGEPGKSGVFIGSPGGTGLLFGGTGGSGFFFSGSGGPGWIKNGSDGRSLF